jgi:tetraacyldisaccharide 4'-kinase
MPIRQDDFKAIISGEREDAQAGIARCLLVAASLGYRLAVSIRNRLYDHRVLRTHRANAAVLSIGNLTTGGTGKTPLVAWMAGHLASKGIRLAILTRGYKAGNVHDVDHETAPGGPPPVADEPAELAAMCPEAPVIVNPDRVAGAAEALRSHGTEVLLLDDGFQHRRLARDLDIVTVDVTLPFGYGKLLPAGLLREPTSGLKRAHAVVLTRCDQVSEGELLRIEDQIRTINRQLLICRAVHAPVAVRMPGEKNLDLQGLRGKQTFAFCGIGNPNAFFDTLERLGCVLVGSRSFDDHHEYTDRCLFQVHEEARKRKADLLLTTQKDWTKIAYLRHPIQKPPLACVIVRIELISHAAELTALISQALGGRMRGLQRFGKQEASRSEN